MGGIITDTSWWGEQLKIIVETNTEPTYAARAAFNLGRIVGSQESGRTYNEYITKMEEMYKRLYIRKEKI